MSTTIDTPTEEAVREEVARGPAPAERRLATGAHGKTAESRWSQGVDWWALGWIGLLHATALAAPFCFTWQGLVAAAALFWITGALGICLGYHRMLAHNSFRTYPAVRRVLAVLGTLAGEGSPIRWISAHRMHHHYSDQPDDPHSPRHGAWWSHMIWLFSRSNALGRQLTERYAKDLVRERFMRMLDATFIFWHLALGAALLAVGWGMWDLRVGISMVIYGMGLRLVFVLHTTWLVNSASHMWGYRNYDIRDDSRNLWWVGLIAFGEGWHNNHHAFPGRARHGHRWWEVDLTYSTICLLERLGLAWRVNHGSKNKR